MLRGWLRSIYTRVKPTLDLKNVPIWDNTISTRDNAQAIKISLGSAGYLDTTKGKDLWKMLNKAHGQWTFEYVATNYLIPRLRPDYDHIVDTTISAATVYEKLATIISAGQSMETLKRQRQQRVRACPPNLNYYNARDPQHATRPDVVCIRFDRIGHTQQQCVARRHANGLRILEDTTPTSTTNDPRYDRRQRESAERRVNASYGHNPRDNYNHQAPPCQHFYNNRTNQDRLQRQQRWITHGGNDGMQRHQQPVSFVSAAGHQNGALRGDPPPTLPLLTTAPILQLPTSLAVDHLFSPCHHQQSVNRRPSPRATAPYVLVAIDDWKGPCPSVTGAQHVFHAVDYNGMKVAISMRTEDEAVRAVHQLHTAVLGMGHAIKRMRADRSAVYTGSPFRQACANLNIALEFTASHSSHHQAGLAERSFRTTGECAQAMLLHAGLDCTFWDWVYLHAVYLCNRQWSSSVNATPYTLMTGRKPDLTDLHVFGCVAWVNIPVPMRAAKGKMTPTSWPGIYVDHHEDTDGYRIYSPATSRETVKRDVIFDKEGPQAPPPMPPSAALASAHEGPPPPHQDEQYLPRHQEGGATALPALHISGSAQLRSPYFDLSDYHPTLPASAIAEVVRPYSAQMAALALPASTVRVSKAPRDYKEAVSSNHPDDWKHSMDREIASITNLETFVWTCVPELRRNIPSAIIIQTAWALADTHDKDGNLIKRKARVVVRIDQLTAGETYDDTKTYAPVARFIALCTTIALAVQLDWELYHLDAPKAWFFRFSSFLRDFGFITTECDPGVWTLLAADGSLLAILCVYVNDIMLGTSPSSNIQERIQNSLFTTFDATTNGLCTWFLGMDIDRKPCGVIHLHKEKYINDILTSF
eukprot:jgi/Tetstr1/461698/TSEL_006798.t1